jgi:NAD(P)-dependent dehydrogenase (short-subunit alcohol dehydrogenase family)
VTTFEPYHKKFDLSSKIALIASGGGGIGSVMSESFAAFGGRIVLTGLTISTTLKIYQN